MTKTSSLFERIERHRRRPTKVRDEVITQAHGSGGKAMQDLIDDIVVGSFRNPWLSPLEDQARFPLETFTSAGDRLAFTTDSYVVDPLFFPGATVLSVSARTREGLDEWFCWLHTQIPQST